jgi:uncharacterized protein YkwD
MMRALVLLAVAAIAVAPREGEGDGDKVKLTPQEQTILDKTNEARKKEGLAPLKLSPTLVEIARQQAKTMAKVRKLEHDIDGAGPEQRFKKAGYKFFFYAENIHVSKGLEAKAADRAMKDWLESKVHRSNLLNKEFTEIGIGMATNDAGETYFSQDFGRPLK